MARGHIPCTESPRFLVCGTPDGAGCCATAAAWRERDLLSLGDGATRTYSARACRFRLDTSPVPAELLSLNATSAANQDTNPGRADGETSRNGSTAGGLHCISPQEPRERANSAASPSMPAPFAVQMGEGANSR